MLLPAILLRPKTSVGRPATNHNCKYTAILRWRCEARSKGPVDNWKKEIDLGLSWLRESRAVRLRSPAVPSLQILLGHGQPNRFFARRKGAIIGKG